MLLLLVSLHAGLYEFAVGAVEVASLAVLAAEIVIGAYGVMIASSPAVFFPLRNLTTCFDAAAPSPASCGVCPAFEEITVNFSFGPQSPKLKMNFFVTVVYRQVGIYNDGSASS